MYAGELGYCTKKTRATHSASDVDRLQGKDCLGLELEAENAGELREHDDHRRG